MVCLQNVSCVLSLCFAISTAKTPMSRMEKMGSESRWPRNMIRLTLYPNIESIWMNCTEKNPTMGTTENNAIKWNKFCLGTFSSLKGSISFLCVNKAEMTGKAYRKAFGTMLYGSR